MLTLPVTYLCMNKNETKLIYNNIKQESYVWLLFLRFTSAKGHTTYDQKSYYNRMSFLRLIK